MKQINIEPPSPILAIFERSRVYGARYTGESLPFQYFPFPDDTWLTRRLREVRLAEQGNDE